MRALVVANWKMNPPAWKEAKRLFDATKKAAYRCKGVDVIIAPPSVYLHALASNYRGKRLRFAGQHGHPAKSGAYTGEVSLVQLKDAGATAALVGHAERRLAGESNDDTRQQVASALALKLMPILCVGEKARGAGGEHFSFIAEQLRTGLADVAPSVLPRVLIAYEPVWAIGGEKPMEPRGMHEMGIFIRKTIVERFGETGYKAGILYGGAVDAQNAAVMIREGDVQGLLVGRASTDSAGFAEFLLAVQAG